MGLKIIVILDLNDQEWFQEIVQFHARSDEGLEKDEKVLEILNKILG